MLKVVGYDAGRDGEGRASLYRKEGTGNRQPAVLGAVELRLEGFLDGAGVLTEVPPTQVLGIALVLHWAWGERTPLTVGFANPVTYGEVSP